MTDKAQTVDETQEPTETEGDSGEGDFTEEMRLQVQNAYYHWHSHGYPEKAAVLFECLQQSRPAPANLLRFDGDIQPQTSIDPTNLEIPERHGPKATAPAWREFAMKTLDMDPTIIKTLQRDEIIKILEANKVIPKESQSPKKK